MKNRSAKLFKLFILVICLGTGFNVYSQSSTNPDTVCVGASGEVYYVNANSGSSYNWEVTGSGNTKNASGSDTLITIDWALTTGTDTIKLIETNIYGCISDTYNLIVVRIPMVTAEAGSNQIICANSTLTISGASATNYSALLWTTNGSGSFTGATSLTPTYTPSSADTVTGQVRLYLTAYGNSPCGNAVDSIDLDITPEPYVFAGNDIDICASDQVTISTASARNYSSITWTTSGTGSFDNANVLTPTYTASSSDTASGSITLYLTANGNHPCSNVVDSMIINFVPVPIADAGSDQTICANSTYTVSQATARNYSSISWSTSGSGNFTNSNTLTPTYTPDASDTASGSVTLYLTVNGNSTCTSISDSFVLNLIPEPTVYAGVDTAICATGIYTELNATATNYSSINWSSDGTGSLVNETTLMPTYIPSTADITKGSFTLTISINGNTPCNAVNDNVLITINPKPTTPVIKHN